MKSGSGPVSYELQMTTPHGVMERKRHQDHIRADPEATSSNQVHGDFGEDPWQPSGSPTGTDEVCARQPHD